MKKYLLLLIGLFILLCIGPASADLIAFAPDIVDTNAHYNVNSVAINNATQNYAVSTATLTLGQDSNIDFTVYFNDGTTKTGSIDYTGQYLGLYQSTTITLDGVSKTLTGPHIPGSTAQFRIDYLVENKTTYLLRLSTLTLSAFTLDYVTTTVDAPPSNPILALNIVSSNNPFDVIVEFSTIESLAKASMLHEEGEATFLGFIQKYLTVFYEIIELVWSYFKFFFIDNLYLTIILIEGGICAYRMSTSKDVFRALSYIISDNERLLRGIIEFISLVASLVWDLVNMLNPMRWLRGG